VRQRDVGGIVDDQRDRTQGLNRSAALLPVGKNSRQRTR
jgi:hypothetical protein